MPFHNRTTARDSSMARKGEVPNDLIGRAYKSFTEDERNYVQTFRTIHQLCLSCGAGDHASNACTHAPPSLSRPRSTHKNEADAIKPSCRPQSAPVAVGKEGRVPYDPIGVAYRKMTPEQRDRVYEVRKNNYLCTSCGDNHIKYNCEVRSNAFARAMAKKKADIRSGKLVLDRKLDAPIFKLPTELLLQVFEEALKEDIPVKVRRGTLFGPCQVPELYKTAIKAFFSVNDFKISGGLEQRAFGRMIKALGVEKNIRSLYFSSFGYFCRNKFGEGNPAFNGDIQLMHWCKNLVKIKLTIHAGEVCHRLDYHDFSNIPVKVDKLVERYELMKLFKCTSIKAVCIDGVDEPEYAAECVGQTSLQGVWDLRDWMDEEYERHECIRVHYLPRDELWGPMDLQAR